MLRWSSGIPQDNELCGVHLDASCARASLPVCRVQKYKLVIPRHPRALLLSASSGSSSAEYFSSRINVAIAAWSSSRRRTSWSSGDRVAVTKSKGICQGYWKNKIQLQVNRRRHLQLETQAHRTLHYLMEWSWIRMASHARRVHLQQHGSQ